MIGIWDLRILRREEKDKRTKKKINERTDAYVYDRSNDKLITK